MSGSLHGIMETVRRLLGLRRPRPPAAQAPGARPHGAAGVPPSWALPPTGGVTLRWQKERTLRPSGARSDLPAAVLRQRTRQRFLVLGATLAILLVTIVLAARMAVPRTLPRAVRGVWQTDAAAYRDRRFELRRGVLAFEQGASASLTMPHPILRVWQRRTEHGLTFRVRYLDEGAPLEFSFVFLPGPPERIRFPYQRDLVWTRAAGARPLIPEVALD